MIKFSQYNKFVNTTKFKQRSKNENFGGVF